MTNANLLAAVSAMGFAADFTAIDFETASGRSDSACQLAAVMVRDGRIADQAMWMIRPEPLYFSRTNIQIHGITPQQVRKEPVFGELWPEIAEQLGSDCLVAHNASFDMGVLIACLRAHHQTVPEFHYTCTRAIARRTWPHHRRYGLKPLSNWLGIRFRHHDALEDSIACAKILLAAGIDREAESLPDLEKRLRLKRGRAGVWGHRGPTGRSRRKQISQTPADPGGPQLPFLAPGQVASTEAEFEAKSDDPPAIDLQRLMIRAEFIQPLSGMQVAFRGRLRALSRQEAEALATRSGGTCQVSVDESTDLLVVGSEHGRDPPGPEARLESQELTAIGTQKRTIRIVDEDGFLRLVISPPTPK